MNGRDTQERHGSQLLGRWKGSTWPKGVSLHGDAPSLGPGCLLALHSALPQPESSPDTDSKGRKDLFAQGPREGGVLNSTEAGRALIPCNCKDVRLVCVWVMVGRGDGCPLSRLKKGLETRQNSCP